METIKELMIKLDGADQDTVARVVSQYGSLPVRLAMLGLAAIRKGKSPLWLGYPPGVFISYKWDGPHMRDLATGFADHIRQIGYQAYLDVENLDEDADNYFQVPQYITSLQDCSFYVLLLTEQAADLITARKGKTSWIYDEYQHAVNITNSGRLTIVPVLLEPKGTTDYFTLKNVIDLTRNNRGYTALNNILTPDPIKLTPFEIKELASTVEQFDRLFLKEQWFESNAVLKQSEHLGHTFDHQFRRMLHSMYTGNQSGLDKALTPLHAIYGQQLVYHIYKGYCDQHGIPNMRI